MPRPLLRVELEPSAKNPEIYNLPSLLQVKIKVESFKPRNDPPLCRNCQRLSHTKRYCQRTPRCIKCGDNHASDKCTLNRTDPCKCVNCGGQHPANYRGCPAFQKLRQPVPKATEEIRRCGTEQSSLQSASLTNTNEPELTRKSFASAVKLNSQTVKLNSQTVKLNSQSSHSNSAVDSGLLLARLSLHSAYLSTKT